MTCPGDISIDNQEEGDGDFVIHCNDLIKDDSAPVTTILELFKHTVFTDADKNHDDCGEWDGYISCKKTLLGQIGELCYKRPVAAQQLEEQDSKVR